MRTQRALFNRALSKANVVGAGQTATASDFAIVEEAFSSLVAELEVLRAAFLAVTDDLDEEEIPAELFEHIASLLAMDIGPDFGLPASTFAAREQVFAAIRRLTASRATYDAQIANYF